MRRNEEVKNGVRIVFLDRLIVFGGSVPYSQRASVTTDPHSTHNPPDGHDTPLSSRLWPIRLVHGGDEAQSDSCLWGLI